MDEPFFGVLCLKLTPKEDPSCRDMWTDARTLGFNPTYVESLTDLELRGLIAHVVTHVAVGHPWRQADRDPKAWNEACDLAINPVLLSAGHRLPPGSLVDPEFTGMPAELIYAKRPLPTPPEASEKTPSEGESGDSESESSGGESGEGEDAPKGESSGPPGDKSTEAPSAPGEVRPAPEGVEQSDWNQAVLQAAQLQGTLPGQLERLMGKAVQPQVNWKEALREFVRTSGSPEYYAWTRPNRRWLAQGLYMPSLQGQSIQTIVLVRDTSGSITGPYLDAFNAEVLDVVRSVQPEQAYLLDCDADIAQVVELNVWDLPDDVPAKGGGGTRFEPVFEWLKQQGIDPSCLIYLTDLQGSFPSEEPDFPVLWVAPEGYIKSETVPFGQTLGLTL